MAKFSVSCYYTYAGTVEVEADSYEEAFKKGSKICEEMKTDELHFCGYTDGTVVDENGNVYEM